MKDINLHNLTSPQKSIWLVEQFYKGTNVNNITGVIPILQIVDFDKLKKAINKFVENNDSYRLRLVMNGDVVMQYISEYSLFNIDIVDVNSDKELTNVAKKFSHHSFEMLDNQLFEFKLFRFPDGHGGFIFNTHHLISDSWTTGITINEIISMYYKLLQGESIDNITKEDLSYINYIVSEQEYVGSERFQSSKLYWNELYKTIPEVATIPSVNIDSSKKDNIDARRIELPIDSNLLSKIKQYSSDNNISVFNFLMSVYAIYISRVSNLEDFSIGTPILNRSGVKEKHTSGMFINTLPLRIKLNDVYSFKDFISNIARDSKSLLRNQKYSYQYLLEDLRKIDSSLSNLFNIIISYQITKITENMEEVPHENNWLFNNCISEDINIHIFDFSDKGSLSIAYDYKLNKYAYEDMEDIHARIIHMIEQVLNKNDILLNDIDIVTPEEKKQILKEFNNTTRDYPNNKTVDQLFEEQSHKSPDVVALVFEDHELTYNEVNQKANRLACLLREKGVSNLDSVALIADKSLDLFVSIIAILKASGMFVPIDITYPRERIDLILNDCNPKVIIADENFKDYVSEKYSEKVIELPLLGLEKYSSEDLECTHSSKDPAYVMYTSGSTGIPKGAIVPHKAIARLVLNTNYIEFKKADRILQASTIAFDASTLEIWGALLNGLPLYIMKKEQLLNIENFEKYLIDNKITILWLTVAIFNQYAEVNSNIFRNLRVLLTGGDVLLPRTINMVKKSCPNVTLINGYGPTENTTFSCCFKITATYEDSIPIGGPIANSTCYVVNNKCNSLQPIGVPGELYVGGDGVAKGYLNNETLTNSKFVKDPFSNNGSIYKTGDLVCWLPDGTIKFIGRIDNQVKIRGFRVELSEIENKISQYKNVKDSVVLVLEHKGRKYLCAYLICNDKIELVELRNYLEKSFPNYMIPSKFIIVDKFTINQNGKIDRQALKTIDVNIDDYEIISPRNSTDNLIVDILMELLDIKNISISDSVIELGIDSLMSINLSIKINSRLNTSISVKNIFSNPIISDLSDYISNNMISSDNNKIVKTLEKEYYPTSSAQKRMYYSSNIDDENSILYNVAGGIILDETPDIEKLEMCLKELINRHESLRTYFEVIDGKIVQKIEKDIDFKLTIEKGKYSEINLITNSFIKPFKLDKAPLFRAKLVKLDNKKCLILLDMHHIMSDGTSLSILLKELCNLYNGNKLKEKTIDYKDFSVWENNRFNSNEYRESEKYWVSQFNDEIPLLNLPTTYPRANIRSFEGSSFHAEFDRVLTDKINDISKKLGVTPYMLLLSAYYILLYKYTGDQDIVVGSPIVGRDTPEVSDIIGMFVNTLALRSNIDSSNTFNEYLENVKNLCVNSFTHQTYPFDELINKLKIKRDMNRNPLFDTVFIYQNEGYSTIDLNGIIGKSYIPDANISKFDLSLEIAPEDDILKLKFEYCTKLFDNDYIERLSKHYIHILKTVVENSNIEISKIDILSNEERNKILNDFNNTDFKYDKNKGFVELFEEQVNRNPDKIAIIFENKGLSYKELNNRANQLANCLINKNVKKNDIVGIMLNRSVETIICMLGVLKAGAGYMLINTSLPFDRILYMLQNSGSHLLITSKNIKNIDFENQIYIDTEDLSQYNKNNTGIKGDNEDRFCVIYTSGTEGNPKGVLIKKQGISNLIFSYKECIHVDKYNTFLSTCSISFDMFGVEIFVPLSYGKKIVLANEEECKIPSYIGFLIKNSDVDYMLMTPSKLQLLIENESSRDALKFLKSIQVGGEAFPVALYENLINYTEADIFNEYGPSEITSCCSYKKITSSDNINIGTPFCNTKIFICDKDMNLCPIGIPGELCVTGDGVSKGYINNQEMTNSSFLPNPFGNELIYKTGDIGKYNPNGEIEYIGRKDFQIKIRGLRVELSEIEKQLLLVPDINNSAVVYNKVNVDEYITGFFTANKKLDTNKIRNELLKHLPLYMVPRNIIQLDNFPITTNGKIDKNELLKYNADVSNSRKYVKPETELQELLCKIWEQLLNTQVGIDDDFFELGADSLTAIRFKTELLSHNINIPYSDLFKYTTIRRLTAIHDNNLELTRGEDFDYSNINSILSKNVVSNINKNKIIKCTNNNILLLGANGFVGSHILHSFIKQDTGKIYCIIREKNNKSAYNRIIDTLHFYFGNELDDEIDKRIFIIQANITEEHFGLSEMKYNEIVNNISVVINTAAMVKHYGDDNKFKKINIDLTQNIIDFCIKYNKRLIYTSTTSVSGNMSIQRDYTDSPDNTLKLNFSESNLYIGQELDTIYTNTKFKAEKLILENISKGLTAQILRLGNMTNRYIDGKFQVNSEENAFFSRLRTFINMKCIPESLSSITLEFTPVDMCANAAIHIMQNNIKNISVFHLYNDNYILMNQLCDILNKENITIQYVSDEDFVLKVREISSDKDRKNILSGIISDIDNKRNLSYSSNIKLESEFTKFYLHMIGFDWPNIDAIYLKKYIEYFKQIGLI